MLDALRKLAEHDIGALLVMEGERLLGIFTERDYARKLVLLGRFSKDTKVREVMTTDVPTVAPEASLEEAMRLMTERRTRHLPVVEGSGSWGWCPSGTWSRPSSPTRGCSSRSFPAT